MSVGRWREEVSVWGDEGRGCVGRGWGEEVSVWGGVGKVSVWGEGVGGGSECVGRGVEGGSECVGRGWGEEVSVWGGGWREEGV